MSHIFVSLSSIAVVRRFFGIFPSLRHRTARSFRVSRCGIAPPVWIVWCSSSSSLWTPHGRDRVVSAFHSSSYAMTALPGQFIDFNASYLCSSTTLWLYGAIYRGSRPEFSWYFNVAYVVELSKRVAATVYRHC